MDENKNGDNEEETKSQANGGIQVHGLKKICSLGEYSTAVLQLLLIVHLVTLIVTWQIQLSGNKFLIFSSQ